MDTRLALQDAQRRLASVLGLEPSAGTLLPGLSDTLPKLPPATIPGLGESPDVARASLGVDKAVADSVARSTIDASVFGASLVLEPRYRDNRDDPSSLPSALTDFFDYDNDAGINWNLSLSLDLPLTARAARDYRRRLDLATVIASGY